MILKVRKVGNSLGVILPKGTAELGQDVEVDTLPYAIRAARDKPQPFLPASDATVVPMLTPELKALVDAARESAKEWEKLITQVRALPDSEEIRNIVSGELRKVTGR
jgi:CRISPR/Cas system-associated protein Cas5 (RAMP superfamily)